MIQGQWTFFEEFDSSAVDTLLKEWLLEYPDAGLFALVAEASKSSVEDLQTVCKRLSMPLIGAIFPEIIHAAKFEKKGLLLIRMDKKPAYVLAPDLKSDQQIGELANKINALVEQTDNKSLFLLFDAMVPNVASIVDKLYLALADSVQYSGLNAGSETFQPMPCLFDGDATVQDGVLALIMPEIGQHLLAHGYPLPEDMIIATSAKGNCIESIDWQPAFEVYQQLAKEWYGFDITADNFYECAVHLPFGIVLASGEILVRIPVGLSAEGALYCVGEVPENSILTILHCDDEVLHASVKALAKERFEAKLKGLTFYCAGRRMHLGVEKAETELAEFAGEGFEVIGALSLGEVGMSEIAAYPQFHNAALVCSPWWQA